MSCNQISDKGNEFEHEWITVSGIDICHWCGVNKIAHEKTKCHSKIKLITGSGKLQVIKR